ncbi:MAG: hypothetical protein UR96_C0002G0020 [candidate division WS6 bacterium GW2011_GWC1_36_11]|uniref:Resolvase/invertase-type recombinase catalytic domain-containing protein n=2 Tax=Candidatus Dojkabacteria TaxID=74243 RepID=A0A0G0DVK9_9BACT|nr:MAG: hypothetical protein UR96_C0002G0020 [candidate division WS6 bacterium GW2011_GWC1_36_11]
MNPLNEEQYREALSQYTQAYSLKKKSSSRERELSTDEPRYVIYVRKSTEDAERQVQSIEDQIANCKEFARKHNLKIVDIKSEEKSAKEAGKRPVFNEIVRVIKEDHLYDSILAWHPDRLARNMKESGEILDMLDNDILFDLKFVSFTFNNDAAGKMTLSILFAMAKEFSDKLSDDTKRGIKKKVKEGKYCGSAKKGYYKNRKDYYRPDDTHPLYVQLWKDILHGYSYKQILEKYKELNFKQNSLSNYLKDPFYAGFYSFGDIAVDLLKADPEFIPQVSVVDFLSIRKMKVSKVSWHTTSDFLPFRDLVKCADCNSYMIPGRSTSASGEKYLYIACGNNECKATLKKKDKKVNSIRAKVLVESTVEFLSSKLNVDEKLYNDSIKVLKKQRYESIFDLEKKLSTLKANKTKQENIEQKLEDEIAKEDSTAILTDKLKAVLYKIRDTNVEIKSLEESIAEAKINMEIEIPSYERFVNFFKNAVTVLQNTEDPYLIDELVKMVFLNIYVGGKKVLAYDLKEPFRSYELLKFQYGVDNGT